MRWVSVIVPIVGLAIAAGLPLVRYAVMERHERTAIAVLHRVQEAQRVFKERAGGFATDVTSLTNPCGDARPVLAPDVVDDLVAAGYSLTLRRARAAARIGQDCHAREVVTDYYVAAAPRSAAAAARQAFAGRSEGGLYLFVDGVAPLEVDLDAGLATPVTERESFKIP